MPFVSPLKFFHLNATDMFKHKITTLFIGFISITTTATSYAQSSQAYNCRGKIQQVEVGPSGDVNATFNFTDGSGPWIHVCNLNTQEVNVSPTTCKAILSVLIIAQSTKQSVWMWFNNTSGTCTLNAWSRLSDYGWYWGPSLTAD